MENIARREYVSLLLALVKRAKEKRNGARLPSGTLTEIKKAIKRKGIQAGHDERYIRRDIRVALLKP